MSISEVLNILKPELDRIQKEDKSVSSAQNLTAAFLMADTIALYLETTQDFHRRLLGFLTLEYGNELLERLNKMQAETDRMLEEAKTKGPIKEMTDSLRDAIEEEENEPAFENIFGKKDKKLN